MIFRSDPASITHNFYCLGTAYMPSFLLDGDHPIMFDAGMYEAGEFYFKEILRIMGNRRPEYLFLTHVHFDHCGAAGYLKRFMPELKIGASREANEIIQKPSAVELITKLNASGKEGGVYFEPFSIDLILNDGDVIEVAKDLTVQVIRTPGHTRDMLSFYIPEQKILIPSESIGMPGYNGYVFSEFLIDYDIYLNSLVRLKDYDAAILIFAHGVYYTGDDAKNYIPSAIKHTGLFREKIENLLDKYGGDYDGVASAIKKEEYDPIVGAKQPEAAYLLNLHAKIKAVARHLARN